MRIIIAGAGDMGFHLAELLSIENQEITIIDVDADRLDYINDYLDVLTLEGDASVPSIQKLAGTSRADLFIAVTSSEELNLIASMMAKQAGAAVTIARVNKDEYITEDSRQKFEKMGIDAFFSPRQLALEEIVRLLKQSAFTDVQEFEDGRLNLIGITLQQGSPLIGQELSKMDQQNMHTLIRPIAILRGHRTLIPHGLTTLRQNDHIYFITHKEDIKALQQFVGKLPEAIKRVMILGGTSLGISVAQVLENNYQVTMVEADPKLSQRIATMLDDTLVVTGEAGDTKLLLDAGLEEVDAFIGLTENSETNIIASLVAKNHGVKRTIAHVHNRTYTYISQDIGVDALINKKILAANSIFRHVRKGHVDGVHSLHGVDAEIIEYTIHKSNRTTRKPLKELDFPDTARIGGVLRDGKTYIPDGDFQLALHDKVIVIALPSAIAKVEKMFR